MKIAILILALFAAPASSFAASKIIRNCKTFEGIGAQKTIEAKLNFNDSNRKEGLGTLSIAIDHQPNVSMLILNHSEDLMQFYASDTEIYQEGRTPGAYLKNITTVVLYPNSTMGLILTKGDMYVVDCSP